MDGACGAYGVRERGAQGSGGETWGKETTRFNFKKFYILLTQGIYVFCVDLRTNNHDSPYGVNWLVLKVKKSKGLPQQAEVAQGVPVRLRPRIFLTFGTTRVVGRQPDAPAAFIPGEIPGTHFKGLSLPQGTWFCRGYHERNPQWHHRESIPRPSD